MPCTSTHTTSSIFKKPVQTCKKHCACSITSREAMVSSMSPMYDTKCGGDLRLSILKKKRKLNKNLKYQSQVHLLKKFGTRPNLTFFEKNLNCDYQKSKSDVSLKPSLCHHIIIKLVSKNH